MRVALASALGHAAAGKMRSCLSAGGRRDAELAAIADLALAYRRLSLSSDGAVDFANEAGRTACTEMLQALAHAAKCSGCALADRSYRQEFATEYRRLLPDSEPRYLTGILEAAASQWEHVALNGDRHQLSQRTIDFGHGLREAWGSLSRRLRSWTARAPRGETQSLLARFDTAWARFERAYITDLMRFMGQARAIVAEAMTHELLLQHAEVGYGMSSMEAREARRRFVESVSRLNALANWRRKGRSDLSAEVIEMAFDVIAEGRGEVEAGGAALAIARQVAESFAALREYLREASSCTGSLDPYLGKNVGLSARLADWEEKWETGRRFLDEPLRRAFSAAVASVARARARQPALAAMCEDCGAELFLVLPRILLLAFLRSPEEHAPLMQSFMPDAFVGEGLRPVLATDLEALLASHRRLEERLGGDAGAVLLARAVSVEARCPAELAAPEREAVRAFMRDLEAWSIAVQRRCPEDWNSCASVILKVIDGR